MPRRYKHTKNIKLKPTSLKNYFEIILDVKSFQNCTENSDTPFTQIP